jgi:hypothetical protein
LINKESRLEAVTATDLAGSVVAREESFDLVGLAAIESFNGRQPATGPTVTPPQEEEKPGAAFNKMSGINNGSDQADVT